MCQGLCLRCVCLALISIECSQLKLSPAQYLYQKTLSLPLSVGQSLFLSFQAEAVISCVIPEALLQELTEAQGVSSWSTQ